MNQYTNKYGIYVIPEEIEYTYTARTIIDGYVHEGVTIDYIRSVGGNIIHAGTGFGDFLPGLKEVNKIYSFEPNVLMYECAKQVIELNELTNVQLFNMAIGANNGHCKLNHIDSKGREMGPRSEITNGYDTVMVTLDTIIPDDVRIDLIHLDLEGSEFDALEGAKNIIERCKPIIVLEIDGRAVDYNEYMESIGYQTHRQLIYNSNEDMVFVNTAYLPID
jgi:FkbM family methyltransferase